MIITKDNSNSQSSKQKITIKPRWNVNCKLVLETPKPMKKYKIQRKRTISDRELIKIFHDDIIIPKMMDSKNNESLGNFIKKLSEITRKFL